MIGEKLEFRKGPRGGKLVYLEGYNYRRGTKKGVNQVFYCFNNSFSIESGKKCRAHLKVYRNILVKVLNLPHNHESEPPKGIANVKKIGNDSNLGNNELSELEDGRDIIMKEKSNGEHFEDNGVENGAEVELIEDLDTKKLEDRQEDVIMEEKSEPRKSKNADDPEKGNDDSDVRKMEDDGENDAIMESETANFKNILVENGAEKKIVKNSDENPKLTLVSEESTPEATKVSENHKTFPSTEVEIIQTRNFDSIFQETPKFPRSAIPKRKKSEIRNFESFQHSDVTENSEIFENGGGGDSIVENLKESTNFENNDETFASQISKNPWENSILLINSEFCRKMTKNPSNSSKNDETLLKFDEKHNSESDETSKMIKETKNCQKSSECAKTPETIQRTSSRIPTSSTISWDSDTPSMYEFYRIKRFSDVLRNSLPPLSYSESDETNNSL